MGDTNVIQNPIKAILINYLWNMALGHLNEDLQKKRGLKKSSFILKVPGAGIEPARFPIGV